MCLVIATVAFIFAFNLYNAEMTMYALFAAAVGIFFIALMIAIDFLQNSYSVAKSEEAVRLCKINFSA